MSTMYVGNVHTYGYVQAYFGGRMYLLYFCIYRIYRQENVFCTGCILRTTVLLLSNLTYALLVLPAGLQTTHTGPVTCGVIL